MVPDPPSSASNAAATETVALLMAIRGGDDSALDALFERYYPRVCRIASLRIGCRLVDFVDYEDIVQDSLLEAFLQLPNLEEWEEGRLLNWLAVIVQNNIIDQRRRSQTLKRGEGRTRPVACLGSTILVESMGKSDLPSPSQLAIANELEDRLESAFLRLDERHRRVIDLRRLCGLSYLDVAEEMKLGGEATARSLFSRALNRLALMI